MRFAPKDIKPLAPYDGPVTVKGWAQRLKKLHEDEKVLAQAKAEAQMELEQCLLREEGPPDEHLYHFLSQAPAALKPEPGEGILYRVKSEHYPEPIFEIQYECKTHWPKQKWEFGITIRSSIPDLIQAEAWSAGRDMYGVFSKYPKVLQRASRRWVEQYERSQL